MLLPPVFEMLLFETVETEEKVSVLPAAKEVSKAERFRVFDMSEIACSRTLTGLELLLRMLLASGLRKLVGNTEIHWLLENSCVMITASFSMR